MALTPEVQASIQRIVMSIKRGVVIPIVGYDMLFNEFDGKESERDFLKRLIKIHAKDDKLEQRFEAKYKRRDFTGYELMNLFYHDLENKDNFKLELSNTIQAQRYNWQLIPESFRKLVSIKHFELFINGTFTNTLDLAFNSYRAKGLDQDEIKSSYQVLNYHPSEPDVLHQSAPPRFHIKFEKPAIYNLFGTHDEERGDYLLTDADYIEIIYDLILDRQQKFKNILSYLNKGTLLFLGCNFPDWFFRFFIRVCVGDRLDSLPKIDRKTVIDSLNSVDSNRSVFINQYKIETVDIDCNTLIDEIFQAFSKENGSPSILGDRRNNNVFISYCRADEQVANDISSQFESKYIEYFLDSEILSTGDNLNDKITEAIDKCCVFLPIVSNNVQQATPYVWKEWQYAVTKKKTIWPVFKEFVDPFMLLSSKTEVSNDVRNQVLSKNNTLGFVLGELNQIDESKIKEIKEAQYQSRVSGNKKQQNF
jgi:hypothetical protein